MIPPQVQDVMTRNVVTVTPWTPYREVVDLLVRRRVTAAPVVDARNRVVGVVSEADALYKVEFGAGVPGGRARPAVAGDVMTSPAITVPPEVTVAAAARRMETQHVKRLPVVDAGGRLVGIVSRRDLLRVHLRPDPDIRDDVVDVLRGALGLDPVGIEADVADGRVTLTGRVERRSTACLAVRLTAAVPGVVAVVDRMAWNHDDTDVVAAEGYAFGDPRRLVRAAGRGQS